MRPLLALDQGWRSASRAECALLVADAAMVGNRGIIWTLYLSEYNLRASNGPQVHVLMELLYLRAVIFSSLTPEPLRGCCHFGLADQLMLRVT